ncbi:MAG: c-type cytochrome [Bacteroidia bacterium]|nr:c-type cytochrome [Bacteroidia bacterium]
MKKILLFVGVLAFTLNSCGDKKKDESPAATEPVKVEETTVEKTDSEVKTEQVALGEKLFTEKTCTACHVLDTKLIGPSIKDIIKIYDEKNGNIVQFLKGTAAPIVDTDPGQVAIMKANLDGFVKDMTPEELQAVAAYMRSAAK